MNQLIRKRLAIVMAIALLWLTGCTQPVGDASNSTDSSPAETSTSMTSTTNPYSALPSLSGEATVEMTINGSKVTIQVNGNDAPVTAGNFVDLVSRGVYNGLVFHRVVRDPQPFVVQGGDPQGKDPAVPPQQLGTGSYVDPATGQSRYIPLEIKPAGAAEPIYGRTLEQAGVRQPPALTHQRGAVAMARSQAPDSASAQFYFALNDLSFLDGNYAVFGYVTSGMEVVDQIQQGDRIETADVIAGLENLSSGS